MIENIMVCTAKFVIAAYTGALSPMLPFIQNKLHLSLGQVGLIVGLFSFFNSILQPLLGWFEDRFNYHYTALLWSPLSVGLFIGSISFVNSYQWLILVIVATGIVISGFHPASFAYLAKINPLYRGMTISLLLLASSVGFIIGPIAISFIIPVEGIKEFYTVALPGILITVGLYFVFSRSVRNPSSIETPKKSFNLHNINKSLYILFIYALFICILSMNIFSFVPFILRDSSQSVTTIGAVLSLFALGSALGPALGVIFAKRMGRKKVMLFSTILAISFHSVFLTTHYQGLLWPIMFFLGLFLMGSYSIIIEMAQERADPYVGTVSSILGGGAWGCGGVSTIITSKFADIYGLRNMMTALLVFLFINLTINIADLVLKNNLISNDFK